MCIKQSFHKEHRHTRTHLMGKTTCCGSKSQEEKDIDDIKKKRKLQMEKKVAEFNAIKTEPNENDMDNTARTIPKCDSNISDMKKNSVDNNQDI